MKNVPRMIFLMSPVAATAAGCPAGHITLPGNDGINLMAACPDTGTNLGQISTECGDSERCAPDAACTAGIHSIRIGTGGRMELTARPYSTPTIHVSTELGECHANLAPGHATGTINIQLNDNVYHAVSNLHRCLMTNAAGAASAPTPAVRTVNWTARSGDIAIGGISHCATTSGNLGKTAATLNISEVAANNIYCWCRMVKPAPTAWTFGAAFTHADTCGASCVQTCAKNFTENATFRGALFNNFLP